LVKGCGGSRAHVFSLHLFMSRGDQVLSHPPRHSQKMGRICQATIETFTQKHIHARRKRKKTHQTAPTSPPGMYTSLPPHPRHRLTRRALQVSLDRSDLALDSVWGPVKNQEHIAGTIFLRAMYADVRDKIVFPPAVMRSHAHVICRVCLEYTLCGQ